jgi:hypothetical protein
MSTATMAQPIPFLRGEAFWGSTGLALKGKTCFDRSTGWVTCWCAQLGANTLRGRFTCQTRERLRQCCGDGRWIGSAPSEVPATTF